MIEQHIYVKTGLGLETLSKSKGLTESYIENNIRPLFSPIDIYYLDEKSFPGVKCAVPLADGGLVISNGIRENGTTPSYIHSYVISAGSVDEFSENPSLFTAKCSYAYSDSPILPALSELKNQPPTADFCAMLHRLSMTESEYSAILSAVFSSREQMRNVFIAVGKKVGIPEISMLLSRIYADLPSYERKSIGYMTLFGEVNIRPEVNIYFVPEDKINLSREDGYIDTYSTSKDYIFDIENKKYLHIDDLRDDIKGEYISFIRSCLKASVSAEDFLSFADGAASFFPHEKKTSLRFYDDLAYIYNIRNNEDSLSAKAGRVSVVFTELFKAGAVNEASSYYSEFIRLYRRLVKSRSALIPLEILRRFILCYDMCPDKQKEEFFDLLSLDIELCMKTSDDEALFTHIDAMRISPSLYERVIETKMLPGKGLIKRYFNYLFDKKLTVHALMEFADSVYADMPQMQTNSIFYDMLKERAISLYDTSGNRLEAVAYLDAKSHELKEKYPDAAQASSEIYLYALESYMSSLVVSDITLSQLDKFPLSDAESLGDEIALKHKTVLAAKEISELTNDVALSFLSYDAFGFEAVASKLSDNETLALKAESDLKEILRRALYEKKDAPKRMLFIIAYYAESSRRPIPKVNFDNIYSFIDRALPDSAFEFTDWYLTGDLFMTPILSSGHVRREVSPKKPDLTELSAFYDATIRYFSVHGKSLVSSRDSKKLKKAADRVSSLHRDYRALTLNFRKSLNLIVRENYSPLRRLFSKIASGKNFKFALIVLLFVSLAVSGLAIGSFWARHTKNGIAETKSYADSEALMLDRMSWTAYKIKNDGTFLPAAECLLSNDKSVLLDSSRDSEIVVSFGTEYGLTVSGISVCAVLSDKNPGFNVYVTDENNRRLSVGVSDYDIESGSSVYSFSLPLTVKNIIIAPKPNSEGTLTVKEVNAYIIK